MTQVEEVLGDAAAAAPGDAAPAAVATLEPAEVPGTRIGPYKLLQEIGEGGMAVVYWQSRPSLSAARWPSRSSS